MFPTISKAKLAPDWAYPLSAKLISESFADVPQAQEISLHFWYSRTTARVGKPYQRTKLHQPESVVYPVLSASYTNRKWSQYHPQSLNEGPRWEIRVDAVPSALKPHIGELLQNEAFPKLKLWFHSKRDVTGRQEHHSFSVVYDENKDELKFDEHFHL